MDRKIRALFVCVHNSARSQMAETFLNSLGADHFEAESAGFEPLEINPLVIEVMKEAGYDLSEKKAQSVFQYYKEGRLYDYVITVCDKEREPECPLFPGLINRINHSFPDPASFTGSHREKLEQTRKVRDMIRSQVEIWLMELHERAQKKIIL